MILLIYINIGQQQQSGIKLITCTKSQMIYITLTLFTCLEKGKLIVDPTYGKITVNYIFADE